MPDEPELPPPPPGAKPFTDPFDDPPVWPVHQRLIGAALRAALACAGGLPLALYLWVDEYRMRLRMEWLAIYACVFVAAFCVFACAKRGSRWWSSALRLAVAGAAMAFLVPLTFIWVENLGDPAEAYEDMTRLLTRSILDLPIIAGILGLFFPAVGLWAYVRSRTSRLAPQIVAGALTLAIPVSVLLCLRRMKGAALFLAVTAILVPLASWFADRLAERFDPKAPAPGPEGDQRTLIAIAGVICWCALSLPASIPLLSRSSKMPHAHGALRTLNTAQALFREADKDHNQELDYAGSTVQLGATNLVYRPLGEGVSRGYVFRLIRGSKLPEFTWAAAADPIRPLSPEAAIHLAVNHEGVIFRSDRPIPLDPEEGKLPENLERAR